ncbi:MAG TPA: hypothetical protein ENK34_10670 [Rhodobacteraceae bacterium]|nr:hypothetical protein [Paracoccaceae bacterium]
MPVSGKMIGLRTYIALGAATAAIAVGGYVWSLRAEIAAARARIAGYERSIATLTRQAEQTALARRVEAARAERYAARAATLNAQIEAILTGDIPDADLDPRIADFINGLQKTD